MEDYQIKDAILTLLHNQGGINFQKTTIQIGDAITPELPEKPSYERLVYCLKAIKKDGRITNPSGHPENVWEITYEGREFHKDDGYKKQHKEEQDEKKRDIRKQKHEKLDMWVKTLKNGVYLVVFVIAVVGWIIKAIFWLIERI